MRPTTSGRSTPSKVIRPEAVAITEQQRVSLARSSERDPSLVVDDRVASESGLIIDGWVPYPLHAERIQNARGGRGHRHTNVEGGRVL